jgi:hypothetical protein
MPFTLSHPAAALPFLRTPLIPAALVVGTMAPDIPYYVPLFVPRDLTHSLLGLVTVDLALGVIGVLLWWFLLREPILDLLPRVIGSRIPAAGRLAWRPPGWGWPLTVAVLLLSVLVGGATHLLWDSFTHPGWVADHLAVLRVQLGPLLVEKWLQHASTVAGLLILTIWAVIRLRAAAPDPDRSCRVRTRWRVAAWATVVIAGLTGGLIPWIHGMRAGVAPFDPGLVFLVARFGIAVGGAAAAIAVCCWYLVPALRRPRPAS